MLLQLTITFSLFLAAEYYSFLVVRSATKFLPPGARITLTGIYVFVTLATWAGLLFFRKIDWASLPTMGKNFYVAFTMGLLVGKILILIVMLGDELRRGIIWLSQWISGIVQPERKVPSTGGISRSDFLMRLAMVFGATSVGGFLYGMTNRYNYRIRRMSLRLPGLPKGFHGMKLVQISDVHAGSFDNHEAVQRGIDMIMKEKPDLIVFTGDLVNNTTDEMLPYKKQFAELHAPLGVYSILGNHDYGDYHHWPHERDKRKNLEDMVRIQEEMGWILLRNEHRILERNGDQIAILGVENWSARPHFPRHGDLENTWKEARETPFKLLLSHDPSHWEAEVLNYPDIALTLAGHTHGMQFGVDIPGFQWSPVQFVYKRWAGLYREKNQLLYVNRGFGFIGYPGRLGILPEITVMELRS